MNLGIKLCVVNVGETLRLRQKVLRPLLRPEECISSEDDHPLTTHLALLQHGQTLVVATFQPQPHPLLSAGFPFRLRWMAADEKHRRRGLSGLLLRHGVELLRERGCDLIWFNARENAFSFYERTGFSYLTDLFDIPGVGPHKTMYKHLIPR